MADQNMNINAQNDEPDDVAAAAAAGRDPREEDSIEEALSSDREAVREELHLSATTLQSAASAGDREMSFGRQMVQLALIPALIVGSVMGVWLIIISLAGRSQDLELVLQKIEGVPRWEANGSKIAGRPARQQAFFDAMALAPLLQSEDLTATERATVRGRLEVVARRQMGGESDFLTYVMKSVGMFADVGSLGLFEEMLASEHADDQYAAILGLYSWQEQGDLAEARSLSPLVTELLDSDNLRIRTVAAVILAGVAGRDDLAARDALARVMGVSTIENREAVWNAGCALAVLGDERGIPVVLSLLDREWLATQPDTDTKREGALLTEVAQNKLILTVLNILVRYEEAEDGEGEGHFAVQVMDDAVWTVVEQLATDDPSEMVRSVAAKVLKVRMDQ